MLEWDERMPRWAAVGEEGWTLRAGGHGRGSVLSVGQGLIEVEAHALAAATDWFLEGVVSIGDYEDLVARSDAVKAELGALARTA